jgi:hypothetical protein
MAILVHRRADALRFFVPIFDGKFVRSALYARITKVVQANIDKS